MKNAIYEHFVVFFGFTSNKIKRNTKIKMIEAQQLVELNMKRDKNYAFTFINFAHHCNVTNS